MTLRTFEWDCTWTAQGRMAGLSSCNRARKGSGIAVRGRSAIRLDRDLRSRLPLGGTHPAAIIERNGACARVSAPAILGHPGRVLMPLRALWGCWAREAWGMVPPARISRTNPIMCVPAFPACSRHSWTSTCSRRSADRAEGIRLSSSKNRTSNYICARIKTPDDSTRSDPALDRPTDPQQASSSSSPALTADRGKPPAKR